MTTRRADRRVERTRSALLQAFVGLLLTADFETISVAGIVARANVGRSTFYNHFRSRDDILAASLSFPSLPLSRIAAGDADSESLLQLLAHFHGQRRLVRVLASGSLRRLWVGRLAEMIEPHLSARMQRLRGRSLLPIPLVALEIAEIQIALVVQWLDSRVPIAPEAVAEAIVVLTQVAVAALLGVRGDVGKHASA